MMSIDNIQTPRYTFPTIDFKFRNAGNGTAFMWNFEVEIADVALDVSPVIRFHGSISNDHGQALRQRDEESVEPGDLEVTAYNAGWGSLQGGTFTLNEPVIDRLVPSSFRFAQSDIASGERKSIFRIPSHVIRQDIFEDLAPNRDVPSGTFRPPFRNDREGSLQMIPLEAPAIGWDGHDDYGNRASGKAQSSAGNGHVNKLFITKRGFVVEKYVVCECKFDSDTTYCTIIDPDKGPHTRAYPISRQIPPGDIERFHIMIGATKSSRMTLRFRFRLEEEHVVESDHFDVSIKNPIDEQLHLRYYDGEEVRRDYERIRREHEEAVRNHKRLVETQEASTVSNSGEWQPADMEAWRLRWLEERLRTLEDFPFKTRQDTAQDY